MHYSLSGKMRLSFIDSKLLYKCAFERWCWTPINQSTLKEGLTG